ncbi:diphthine--ammonia ligase [Archaeoglobus neptunius]|uniref:diphthine--ammonia ligase n=1 Tax=Archaeoglobus neptunius TaxID=2798580 RepID=UPI0019264936|nr:TIGR00289 family protein [Archaeoglobus neptunius]
MRVVALISGGKDSMLALHEVAREHEVVGLLSIHPDNTDSYMFHSVNLHMLDAIAASLNLPLTKLKVSGIEEIEVEELADQVKGIEADALCIGGIESNYQKKRFEKICDAAGLELLAPLWKRSPEDIMFRVARDFEAIIVSVSAMGLNETYLGRKIDEKCVSDLLELNRKYKIHVAGEGGEFETLVLDAPLYRHKIVVNRARKIWDGMRGYYFIESYSKFSKSPNGKI